MTVHVIKPHVWESPHDHKVLAVVSFEVICARPLTLILTSALRWLRKKAS